MELLLNFLLYIFAAVGLSHIIADGSIFAPLKESLRKKREKNLKEGKLKEEDFCIRKFILDWASCYQCNSVLVGITIAFMGWLSTFYYFFWINFILWGFAISIISPFVGLWKLYLSILTNVVDE